MARYTRVPSTGQVNRKPKIFVLDTNIILHDFKAIRKFKDNDLVIPIAVIEELDKFKKGNDQLAYNARGFMRDIDRITEGRSFGKNGVQIAKGLGNIKIEPNHPFPEGMKDLFHDDIPDHRILSTAIWVRDNNPGRFVALVTKDINLRMKSKAAGMEVQDYMTDRVEEEKIENSNKEVQILDDLAPEDIQEIAYGPETAIPWSAISKKRPRPNQLYKIRNGKEIICARFDDTRDKVVLVKSRHAYGIRPRNDEQKFAFDACMNPEIQLVSMTGGAGTGKTLIALASALEQARDYD
ncbi:MAG: PhoH family protein, partial [Bacteroidales bacterium]|nr:PhoH family protein [Bacteroidales bacterium]